MTRLFSTSRALLGGALLLLCAACGDDDAPSDAGLDFGVDGGPTCYCRGTLGTLIYDLRCGEGLCEEDDLIQCTDHDTIEVSEDRCLDAGF